MMFRKKFQHVWTGIEHFYEKTKFKGKIGIFEIKDNIITHELSFYSAEDGKFKKIF